MKALNVFFEEQLVGKLTRDDELVYSFVYEATWRQHPKAFSLSLAMPLSQESFGNKTTLSFFENLLPEGDVKESLEPAHGITSTFDFLEHYGKDCSGAVIVTDQINYVQSNDSNKAAAVDMEKIYTAIDEKGSVADVIASMDPGYLSLAGAQDKFPAIYKDGTFFIPTQGAPTTHIVKAPIQHTGIKESVYNEYYCMELARKVGFPIPKCFIQPGRHPLFVIERYDRMVLKNGSVKRLHQQDFCQAQGKTSEFKYEDKGGPTLQENYRLIRDHVTPTKRIQSIQNFLDWIAFNLVIGNNDTHSKNVSLLLLDQKNELAPFYDLICTAVYPKLKSQFSFKIGGQDDFSQISAKQIKLLEQQLDLKEGTFTDRLIRICKQVLSHKDDLVLSLNQRFPDAKIPKRISQLIQDRIMSLKIQGVLKTLDL